MDNCCDSLMKYFLFILNFFIFVIGAVFIGAGAFVQTQMKNYLDFLGNDYLNVSVVLIVLGVIVLIVGFFGCCGACTESGCMMTTFATLLAILVVAQVRRKRFVHVTGLFRHSCAKRVIVGCICCDRGRKSCMQA